MPLTLTRSLLVILIPGLIAVVPWLLWVVNNFGPPQQFYKDFPQVVWGTLFILATVIGTALDMVSTSLEVEWDEKREKKYQVADNWFDYLARTFSTEPVGYRYLSRMVTRMYFELTMSLAVLVSAPGFALLYGVWSKKCYWCAGVIVLVSAGIAYWFNRSAWHSHEVLCKTRLEINKRLGPVKLLSSSPTS